MLDAAESGELEGDYIPVANVLTVPGRYGAAVEAALGAAAGDLITSHSKHAKRAIEHLKANKLGRATFLAADLVNPRPRSAALADLAKRAGIIGVAADLVEFSTEHKSAIELLLGGVLIAESIDAATALSKEPGFRKIATLDGEIVFSGGAVTGGRSAHQSSGPIRFAAWLREAVEEASSLDAEVSRLDASSEELISKTSAADAQRTEASDPTTTSRRKSSKPPAG